MKNHWEDGQRTIHGVEASILEASRGDGCRQKQRKAWTFYLKLNDRYHMDAAVCVSKKKAKEMATVAARALKNLAKRLDGMARKRKK